MDEMNLRNQKTKVELKDILSILPHRYPFLLIDKILEIDLENTSILGIKNVSFNEPHFVGHFPDQPIMPGVLIVEAMAQLSALLIAHISDDVTSKEVLLMSIEHAKFRKKVVPGDSLCIYAQKIYGRNNVIQMQAKASVDNILVAESKFSAVISNKSL